MRARASLVLLAALLPASAGAQEAIRPALVEGEIVYTHRPARKPQPAASPAAPAPKARRAAPEAIDRLVREVSARYEMDPRLVTTVISVESGFNHMAVSPKGARGLMQLMPQTARQYGVKNVHDPRENVEGGVAYLKDLTRRYRGDMRLALAAYNAGPEAVERASGVPNYRETRDYIKRIEARYGILALGGAAGTGGTMARIPTSISATTGEDGGIVYTNVRGTGMQIVRKGRR
ncbi:MAG TPA: lytic transglycosylase domain-containing protein [Candidatus Polarisedimenticolia bacterium]|nr:lytic transglycosylase domain-containing protein [Candidatus Polarisedimenticolia bacterium]